MSDRFSQTNVIAESDYESEMTGNSPPPDNTTSSSSKTGKSTNRRSQRNKSRKRTPEQLELAAKLQTKMMLMKENRTNKHTYTNFRVGIQVSTTDARIAPLSEKAPPGKSKRVRLPLHGTVVKQSEYYPRFWLVNFFDGRSFYVTENVVKFEGGVTPSYRFKRGPGNMLSYKSINKTIKDDSEAILTEILCSNNFTHPTIDLNTYEGLCLHFKPHYKWLTVNLLKNHVHVLWQKIEIIHGTWLESLPEPFPDLDSVSTKKWLDEEAEKNDKNSSTNNVITPGKYQIMPFNTPTFAQSIYLFNSLFH